MTINYILPENDFKNLQQAEIFITCSIFLTSFLCTYWKSYVNSLWLYYTFHQHLLYLKQYFTLVLRHNCWNQNITL